MYKSDFVSVPKQLREDIENEMTMPEFLCRQIEREDKGIYFHFITDKVIFYSYKNLYEKALRMLSYLYSCGVRPGDHMILALGSKQDFVLAFWACALGGIQSVPANNNFDTIKSYMRVLIGESQTYCMAVESDYKAMQEVCTQQSHVTEIMYPGKSILDSQVPDEGLIYRCRYEDVAIIMFSSGSISSPKGVAITHKMLHRYVVSLQYSMRLNNDDVYLGFLPLNHNTALIPFHIFPLFLGIQQYISDVRFMFKDDYSLFDLATRFNATVSGTISSHLFKYANLAAEKDDLEWKLNNLHTFFIGAEPICAETYDYFVQHMEKYGLRRAAVKPAYGMTETTSLITFHQKEELDSIFVDNNYLSIGDKLRLVEESDKNAKCFMPVGEPIYGIDIRIEDDGHVLEEMEVGEVKVKGDSVIQSYYDSNINVGEWLNTGDIGVIKERQLYILGRKKDIVIINGKNYFCSDIEAEIALSINKDTNFITIASITDTSQMEFDTLICFMNTSEVGRDELNEYMEKIYHYCVEQFAMRIHAFILVPEFIKTSSGKVKRHVMKQKYLDAEKGYTEIVRYENTTLAIDSLNEIQRVIKGIVVSHLKCDISPTDSLLAYLQESSSLAMIHLKIDERYMGALNIVDLIKHPTISQLSEIIYHYYHKR